MAGRLRCLLTVLALLFGITKSQNFQGTGSVQASSRFNFFDIELLKELVLQEGTHNFVISPASVKVVLGMLLEGAEGNTAMQIQKALRLDGISATHQAVFNSFLHSLKVRYTGTIVEFANEIFINPDIKVHQQYKESLKSIYLSGVQKVDFTNTHMASGMINGWVSKNTHGLIRTLIPQAALDPHSTAIVANALYFRGKWALPFDRQATTIRCFYPTPSRCQGAFFMETVGQHGYANLGDLNAQALEIFYQGSKFSMIFLLPNNNIDELLRDLSYQPLNTIISKLESTTVVVSIPRFSIEFEADLTQSLSKLGVKDLFTPAANLSGIAGKEQNVFINKIFQKAIIEIDEEGTVGAAASGAVAVPLQGPTLPRFQAAKPFLFFIRDTETGNYLFEGMVEQPEIAAGPVSSSQRNHAPFVPQQGLVSQTYPLRTKINDTPSFFGSANPQTKLPETVNPTNTSPNNQPDLIHYPQ